MIFVVFSRGGVRRQMPQGLSVRVRLLLIGPGAGMRVARASLPRFGALRRDNTPIPACLSIYVGCTSGSTKCSWSCIWDQCHGHLTLYMFMAGVSMHALVARHGCGGVCGRGSVMLIVCVRMGGWLAIYSGS